MFEINEILRSLHLNLQGSKTEILDGDELVNEHKNSDQELLDRIWSKLERLDCRAKGNAKTVTALLGDLRPLARRFRRGLPASVHRLKKGENRTLRRLMTCYGKTGRPYLKNVALTCLKEMPELRMLNKSLTYLGQLDYPLHRELVMAMLEMLEAGVLPFPYQTARIIEKIGAMHQMTLAQSRPVCASTHSTTSEIGQCGRKRVRSLLSTHTGKIMPQRLPRSC